MGQEPRSGVSKHGGWVAASDSWYNSPTRGASYFNTEKMFEKSSVQARPPATAGCQRQSPASSLSD